MLRSTGRSAHVNDISFIEFWEVDDSTEWEDGIPFDGFSTVVQIFPSNSPEIVVTLYCSLEDLTNLKLEKVTK